LIYSTHGTSGENRNISWRKQSNTDTGIRKAEFERVLFSRLQGARFRIQALVLQHSLPLPADVTAGSPVQPSLLRTRESNRYPDRMIGDLVSKAACTSVRHHLYSSSLALSCLVISLHSKCHSKPVEDPSHFCVGCHRLACWWMNAWTGGCVQYHHQHQSSIIIINSP